MLCHFLTSTTDVTKASEAMSKSCSPHSRCLAADIKEMIMLLRRKLRKALSILKNGCAEGSKRCGDGRLVLILRHLVDHGYVDTAERLQSEAQVFCVHARAVLSPSLSEHTTCLLR
eukprot:2501854-Rhodomonas_salina.1